MVQKILRDENDPYIVKVILSSDANDRIENLEVWHVDQETTRVKVWVDFLTVDAVGVSCVEFDTDHGTERNNVEDLLTNPINTLIPMLKAISPITAERITQAVVWKKSGFDQDRFFLGSWDVEWYEEDRPFINEVQY